MADIFADPLRARLALSVGMLLFFTWIFAILAPPMISGDQAAPLQYPQRERPKLMLAQAKRTGYVAPTYPRKALEEGLSGSVTVDFIIDAKGEPTELRIADAQPSGVFDQAVLDAVKHWRYEPFMVDGVPTPVPNRAVLRFDPQSP
jgi:TonB family protein